MSSRVHNPVTEKPLSALFAEAILTAGALSTMVIPPRPMLLGKWLREADIGFIYAPRGVGKTWMSMLISSAITEGAPLGEWTAGEGKRNLLYVDGEMALADTQCRERIMGISGERFRWLHHEHLFNAHEKTLNVAHPECQNAIGAILAPGDVLVLDNLSALCRGGEENSNDDWEPMLTWLLGLRRRKITVILIHHAGRNGEMRGASRREDAVDWVLRLSDDTADDNDRVKAIASRFTKCRGCPPKEAMPLRWTLHIEDAGLTYTCKPHIGPDALLAVIKSGVETASECAEALNVATSQVSKWAKTLIKAGRIRKNGRNYEATEGDE